MGLREHAAVQYHRGRWLPSVDEVGSSGLSLDVGEDALARRPQGVRIWPLLRHSTALLQGNPSKVHVQTDAWTATNHRAYVAIVVNCEREGKRVRFLLDIREVPEGHSGAVLARELEQSREFSFSVWRPTTLVQMMLWCENLELQSKGFPAPGTRFDASHTS